MTDEEQHDAPVNDGPRRVEIKVPEQYRAVSDTVWEDLESYLYNGFLTSPAYILGKTFVFKTINHYELSSISFLRPLHKAPPDVGAHYKASFIAHSVLIVDGVNVIYKRPEHMAKLIKTFSKIPPEIQEEIVTQLSFLNGKAYRLHPLTEVYVHENRSRYRWIQLKDIAVHSPMATGFAGTDELGMNYVQQTWTALNRLIDYKEQMEADWTNAKFIGSCFNGKGVRSVDQRDRGRKEQERTEREDAKMNVLYRYLNRKAGGDEEAPSQVKLPDGRMATISKKFRAESIDELADQLSATLSGEKDHHDLVVEGQMERIRLRRSMLEDERQMMYRGSALKSEEFRSTSAPLHGPSRVLGGKAEADAMLLRMRSIRDQYLSDRARQIPGDISKSDGTSLEGHEVE